MKLIDKDALVAEIERKRDICKKVVLDLRSQENKDYYQGKAEAYSEMAELINTLEVKEVDLEEELPVSNSLTEEGLFTFKDGSQAIITKID